MQFICERAKFIEIAVKAAKVAQKNPVSDNRYGVLLECSADRQEVYLTAAEPDFNITLTIQAEVAADGAAVMKSDLLFKMAEALGSDKITFQMNGTDMKISASDKTWYTLKYLPGKSYPKPPVISPADTLKISGICTLTKKIAFIKTKSDNAAFMSVKLVLDQRGSTAVATDRERLGAVTYHVEIPEHQEYFIFTRALELLASMSTDEDIYEIGRINNRIVFIGNNMVFSTAEASCNFINYDRILQGFAPVQKAVVNSRILYQTLDRLAATVGDEEHPVFPITLGEKQIIIKREGKYGNFTESIPAMCERWNNTLFFSIKRTMEILKHMEGLTELSFDSGGHMLIRTNDDSKYYVSGKRSAEQKWQKAKAAA